MIMFFTLFTIETATMMSIFFHRIIKKRMGKYFFYDMLWYYHEYNFYSGLLY